MTKEEKTVAGVLGIDECVIVKIKMGQSTKVEHRVLHRFYLTLIVKEYLESRSLWKVEELYGITVC